MNASFSYTPSQAEEKNLVEKIYTLLNHTLYTNCPVLSGNMRTGIKITSFNTNEIKMVIDAPFYDANAFRKAGVILLTHQGWKKNPSITDYAYWVNKLGAFASRNKSQYWVDDTCYQVCETIVSELRSQGVDADLIYRLPSF